MFGKSNEMRPPHRLSHKWTLPRRAAAIVALALAAAPGFASAATYYVDAAAGSDSAAGTTTATAWKTLAKVNATTFSAGDSILFHTGQSWAGQLHPLGSGTAGHPITLSNYGGGARPIVDGHSLASGGAIYLANQSYWTIDGFDVTSDSGVNNIGTQAAPGTNRSGIFVDNNGGGTLAGINIRNNHVHNVNGCFVCNGADAHNNGGIAVTADLLNPLGWGTDSYNGVLIENNQVDHVGRTGIVFDDYSTGIIILVFYTFDPASLSNNVTIRGNTVYTIDSDGIVIAGSQNNLMEHNIVGHAGLVTSDNSEPSSGGIWAAKSLNTLVQYNEVYDVHTHTTDGQAFDADLRAYSTTFQYNYSHDNEGGFMLMEGGANSGTDLVVRYNLSVNDSWGGFRGVLTFAYGYLQNTSFYNNTIYIAPGLPSNISYCENGNNGGDCSTFTGLNWNFRNNIIANFGSGNYFMPGGSTASIDHNVFYGNHPASEPADAYKLTTDPLFIAPPATAPYGIASVSGYQVSSGSPAASSGALVSGNGGLDYFSRTVSATAAPTRGFYEVVNY